ncbi:MAG: hypothetical protein F4W96_02595 [Chloroflexi bacterium]|nr:hypothetical protein [Chloroflexota bacterium]
MRRKVSICIPSELEAKNRVALTPLNRPRTMECDLMIVPLEPNPFAPSSAAERVATETQMREVARRRWEAQQEHERKRQRKQVVDRVKQIRHLRPGRAVANSLSPIYSMFNESFFRAR